jgi:hypothetical protein
MTACRDTTSLLIDQYHAAMIPIERVSRDYFGITPERLLRKVLAGEIALPIVRMDAISQKRAKGVHVSDLADYLDKRREAAHKECEQLKRSDAA